MKERIAREAGLCKGDVCDLSGIQLTISDGRRRLSPAETAEIHVRRLGDTYVITVVILAGDSSDPDAQKVNDEVLEYFESCEIDMWTCGDSLNVTVAGISYKANLIANQFPSTPPPPPPPPEPEPQTPIIIAISAFCGVIIFLLGWIAMAIRWYRSFKQKALRSAPTANPPTVNWQVLNKGGFACFLSHYKIEAGSDARYLYDLLGRMLQSRLFLDSNDLTDLRTLFEHVHNSDVVLLLATEGVLSRPWCLLELYQAHKHKVPILVVEIDSPRHRFENQEAKRFLRNMEVDLRKINPGAIEEIQEQLRKDGDDVMMRDFRDAILDALELPARAHSVTLKRAYTRPLRTPAAAPLSSRRTTTRSSFTHGGRITPSSPTPRTSSWRWARRTAARSSSRRLASHRAPRR